MTTQFNRDAVDNHQIRVLLAEAAQHGDHDQVALCEAALAGDSAAAERCIDAIEAAWHLAHTD